MNFRNRSLPCALPVAAATRSRRRAVSCLSIVLVSVMLSSCNHADGNTGDAAPAPSNVELPKQAPAQKTPTAIKPEQIQLSEMRLDATDLVTATGEQLPIWKVSGHIKNNSSEPLAKLRVQIYFKTRATGALEEEINLELATNIAPQSEGTFSTQFAMRTPQRGWDLYSEVLDAQPGPR